MAIAQLAPGASGAVHPFAVMVKSAAFAPPREITGFPDATAPGFATVKVTSALSVPPVTEPKSCSTGAMVIGREGVPEPVNGTARTPPGAAMTESVADRDPVTVGAKWTLMVQVAPTASGLAQPLA